MGKNRTNLSIGPNMPAHAAEVPAVTIWGGHERDALALEANADLHARWAEHDRGPCNGGSKLRMTLDECESLRVAREDRT